MRIPERLLIAACPFGRRLDEVRACEAVAEGVRAAGRPWPDLCPLGSGKAGGELQALLGELDFDGRLRAARALVVAAWGLRREGLGESVAFELATRARQAGVPAYGILGGSRLDEFDARMMDLQVMLEARDEEGLREAGRELGSIA
ncbi:MAG TPA: hypothetical protein VMG62_03055 [Solirubrobacteraceae bacterium]|nr:hypothetical protein [Solirubrobacteraceae bacterium]